ncbi:MFS family permease [Saccharothrix ecbatanensis]|uniref:MFS family permease n=1 Tax=Saccharothrix ecbatanensis TaxID=1105145 RepID=A0A7W9M0M7_9PSEU|nr:MFS transporter [Saccharothrix ecbatanensis]MBB5802948.1 MFS family permease [Saccharothrix ecbatanensis]
MGGSDNGRDPLRVVIATSVVSKVADWQLGIVIPLVILAHTGSVAMTLVAFALRSAPYVASPLLGSLIDRFDKRTVFVLAQLQQALCLALLAVMLSNPLAVAVLLLLSGFGGVVVTITGQFVLIPKLVDSERRETAVARLASAIELAKVVGLLLGGLVFSTLGATTASWCITALYAVAGLMAVRLPSIPTQGPRTRIRQDLAVGFRWLVRPAILWLVVTMALANLAVGELETVLVTVFGDGGVDALVISVVLAAGLLVGAAGSRLGPHLWPSATVEKRILAFQLASFGALCVIALPFTVAKIVGYTAISFALGASNVASITYRQNTIPVELAGRVNAVIRMFITGAIPLSGFVYAWSSRLSGSWFWVPALGLAAVSMAVWGFYTLRSGRTAGLDPAMPSP